MHKQRLERNYKHRKIGLQVVPWIDKSVGTCDIHLCYTITNKTSVILIAAAVLAVLQAPQGNDLFRAVTIAPVLWCHFSVHMLLSCEHQYCGAIFQSTCCFLVSRKFTYQFARQRSINPTSILNNASIK
jgi:hypothetical protein